MVKKFAAFSAGMAMFVAGIAPVFAQAADNATTTPELQINTNMTVAIANSSPFGTGGDLLNLVPVSATTNTAVCTGVASTCDRAFASDNVALSAGGNSSPVDIVMTTNAARGGNLAILGSNSGRLANSGDTEFITNAGAGANLASAAAACTALDTTTTTLFTGVAVRAMNNGETNSNTTNGVWVHTSDEATIDGAASDTTIATKYGDGSSQTNELFCHISGSNQRLATTEAFNQTSTLTMDVAVGVSSGTVTFDTGYSAVFTVTGTANA